ncbi:MAG: YggS family pyridoxal phosphate-dependent enzyme [Parachlamydiaceae bacterium]|nr:YggS family pyridoxal phosphate-dependent enzyme [Parachlamydiaceae bacterium]
MSLVDRYHRLLNDIAVHAVNSGRNPVNVSLVVVSKGYSWTEIEPLYAAGQRHFAENRLPEGGAKIFEAPQDVEWHFIGPIQKNKARRTVENFSLMHSVDSFELAKKISDCSLESSTISRILFQVNVSGEISKQGMGQNECDDICERILGLPFLSVEGLMTMAPFTDNESTIRECFKKLRLLQGTLQKRYGASTFPHLSMGMSNDYPIAISEGATLLRIGSALLSPN